ncbi:hypothetical protein BO78DRAFT_398491 [Aspergillus sclerotiicarbonarius CBS 121057]|uniref:Uncharacterized protein n=1 Tax=Aspergillus sclerotiicarbonarius (strain CBS 121057 / IBT 28362) TaxID=1448318 RepID=A0A319FEJ3_ASPSB|nr:hypothetical protein BO78DRAFT_398491 [Aspergillus sclerotiicarbonarius CBS 121057]
MQTCAKGLLCGSGCSGYLLSWSEPLTELYYDMDYGLLGNLMAYKRPCLVAAGYVPAVDLLSVSGTNAIDANKTIILCYQPSKKTEEEEKNAYITPASRDSTAETV